jgi:hypothetical protein
MNMNKKGQAALEFLTTYGWAFMVILVMIGALAYFGVLNPQKLIPDQCAITSGFTCKDFQVASVDAIAPSTPSTFGLNVINNMGEPITLSGGEVKLSSEVISLVDPADPASGSSCVYYESDGTTPLAGAAVDDGESFVMNCDAAGTVFDAKTTGAKVKLSYAFDYTKPGSTFAHTASGTITATLK